MFVCVCVVCVCACVRVCVLCGSIAKWPGHRPANQKFAGSIPAQDTLVSLLFP